MGVPSGVWGVRVGGYVVCGAGVGGCVGVWCVWVCMWCVWRVGEWVGVINYVWGRMCSVCVGGYVQCVCIL